MASHLETIELRPVGHVSDPLGAAGDKSGQGVSEPVIDIKQYSLRNDLVANSRRPAYAAQLWDKVHQEPK